MDYLVDGGTSFITTDMPQYAKKYFEQKVYQYSFNLNRDAAVTIFPAAPAAALAPVLHLATAVAEAAQDRSPYR